MEQNDGFVVFDGTVVETQRGGKFKVRLEGLNDGVDEQFIIATLAGKLVQYNIRVITGDRVKVKIPTCDLSKGRITWRYT